MYLLKRHLRRDGAQRRYEFARQERVDALGFQCPPAKGRGSKRNRLLGLVHPNVEFRVHVYAHPVARDQRLVLLTGHRKLQGIHAYRRDVVNDRPDECAAVDDNLLAKKTRAHECDFLG